MKNVTLALTLTATVCIGTAFADDWPQWLGPNRDGISIETSLEPLAQTPQPVWEASAGVGVSSVVVSQGRVFVMGHARGPRDRGTDTVYCLSADAGSVAWTYAYDCLSCKSQDVRFYGPRSTPTVDGDRVYTLSLEGHLFCFEVHTGKVLWSRNLTRDLHGRIPVYGYCCSPLVYGDRLILELNAQDATYAALHKSSGDVIWRLAGGDVTGGSPALTRIGNEDCVIFMGGGSVVGADPQTGTQLWRHGTWGHAWMGPAVAGDRIFVANASQPRGCGLIRIDAGKPTVVWEDRAKKFQTLHCNSVIWQNHIYGFDNTGTDYQGKDSRKSSLKCIELDTGRIRWVKPDMGWGNLIVHDHKLIILRETGELVVAKASPEAYEELLRTQVFGGQSWTVPAIANGRLYCRNNAGEVVCMQLYGTSRRTPATVAPIRATPKDSGQQQAQIIHTERMAGAVQSEISMAVPGAQEQWPRFRGPGGLAAASGSTTNSLKEVLWKVPVPLQGESSPIVWETHLFLTGADKDKREIYCFDTAGGSLFWRREVTTADGTVAKETGDILLAASTPVTDGRCVYAIFGNGDVACLDFDGEVKWSRNLGVPKDDYGHASSLEIGGDLLFIQLDQGQADEGRSKLIALHAQSGRTVWETARPVPCSWSSPILIDVTGHVQLITCAEPWVIAYEPATGGEIWRANCLAGQIVSSPVYVNGLVYVVSPDDKLAAIRPDGRGDVTGTHVVWTAEGALPSIPSPVCNGELLWLVDTGGVVTCYDARNGQNVWEKDVEASFQASPTLVGDRLYLLSDGGTLLLLEAGRQYALAGRVELGGQCLASPACCGQRMYIRTKHHLLCLGSRAEP